MSKALIFLIQIGLKLSYFCKKIHNFLALEAPPQTPRTTLPPLQISGYEPEPNHVFAQLISMPLEFFLMPRLKGVNFYQIA